MEDVTHAVVIRFEQKKAIEKVVSETGGWQGCIISSNSEGLLTGQSLHKGRHV